VNQAECLRRGIDAPKSIVTIEVIPAEIPPELRELIAKRMSGIDVCELSADGKKHYHQQNELENGRGDEPRGFLIQADEPSMAGMLMAVIKNEAEQESLTSAQRDEMIQLVHVILNYDLEALYEALRAKPGDSLVIAASFGGSNAQLKPRPEWIPKPPPRRAN